jgi:hypothetical protein
MTRRQITIADACRLQISAAVGLLILVGCDAMSQKVVEVTGGAAEAPLDPFAAAAVDAEPGDKPFLEPARPFLTAVAKRDYAGVYGLLSSHARAKSRPDQFVPSDDPQAPQTSAPIENLTQEQFIEWMQKMEQKLGVPRSINLVYVDSVDPEVLSGQGDRLMSLFAIGGMPEEIPAAIRKASIRASISCELKDEAVKQIAADLNISEDQVRSGKWPDNDKGYDPDERPYLNVKFVLVEEEGQLKVGYFEFMPPSMLD